MAGHLTTAGADLLLAGEPMPTTLYAAGHVADPGVDGTATPAVETRRLAVVLGVPSGGACSNQSSSSLPSVAGTEDWTHLVLWSAPTGGVAWWVVAFAAPVALAAGETVRIDDGALDLSFTLWGA